VELGIPSLGKLKALAVSFNIATFNESLLRYVGGQYAAMTNRVQVIFYE
jgi:hypothetical protein